MTAIGRSEHWWASSTTTIAPPLGAAGEAEGQHAVGNVELGGSSREIHPSAGPDIVGIVPPAFLSETLKSGRDQVLRQILINMGAAVILYFCAPVLARIITAGGDRR